MKNKLMMLVLLASLNGALFAQEHNDSEEEFFDAHDWTLAAYVAPVQQEEVALDQEQNNNTVLAVRNANEEGAQQYHGAQYTYFTVGRSGPFGVQVTVEKCVCAGYGEDRDIIEKIRINGNLFNLTEEQLNKLTGYIDDATLNEAKRMSRLPFLKRNEKEIKDIGKVVGGVAVVAGVYYAIKNPKEAKEKLQAAGSKVVEVGGKVVGVVAQGADKLANVAGSALNAARTRMPSSSSLPSLSALNPFKKS